MNRYGNLINGKWVDSVSGKRFANINPADSSDVVGEFADSVAADVSAAVDAARAAYQKWRLTPAPRRAEILFRAADLLIARKQDFARDMTREMGKVLKETGGDVQEAIDMTFYIAG